MDIRKNGNVSKNSFIYEFSVYVKVEHSHLLKRGRTASAHSASVEYVPLVYNDFLFLPKTLYTKSDCHSTIRKTYTFTPSLRAWVTVYSLSSNSSVHSLFFPSFVLFAPILFALYFNYDRYGVVISENAGIKINTDERKMR